MERCCCAALDLLPVLKMRILYTFCRLKGRYSEWRLPSVSAVSKLSIRLSSQVEHPCFFKVCHCESFNTAHNSRCLWDRLFFLSSATVYVFLLRIICIYVHIYASIDICINVCVCEQLYIFTWDTATFALLRISLWCNRWHYWNRKICC